MKIIKTYLPYNKRRYGEPWVATVNPATAKPDFSHRVGGYTGHDGGEGDLYVTDPQEGTVYMYGQKDYRGGNTERDYALYHNGIFHEVKSTQLIRVLEGDYSGICE